MLYTKLQIAAFIHVGCCIRPLKLLPCDVWVAHVMTPGISDHLSHGLVVSAWAAMQVVTCNLWKVLAYKQTSSWNKQQDVFNYSHGIVNWWQTALDRSSRGIPMHTMRHWKSNLALCVGCKSTILSVGTHYFHWKYIGALTLCTWSEDKRRTECTCTSTGRNWERRRDALLMLKKGLLWN